MQSLTTPNLMRWVINWLFLASWILAEVPAYAASWTATGSLATARNQHTATLLANGKLLVVGDYGTIMTNANGSAWAVRTSGTLQHLNGVARRLPNSWLWVRLVLFSLAPMG